MNGKVIAFRMINGDDIIAEVFNTFSETYELKNPAQIVLQQTDKGMGVALAPFMPFASENIRLEKNAVAVSCEPDQNMVNEYNRIFGAGIQVAPASALAGFQVAK